MRLSRAILLYLCLLHPLAARTATAVEAGVDSCAKPLIIPDRFNDIDGSGSFTPGDVYDPLATGYAASGDVGLQMVLHAGLPPGTVPGQYFIADYPPMDQGPPLVGEQWFREWMSGCSPYPVLIGDEILIEPGNLVSAMASEVDALIARDSTAVWDEGSSEVVGSQFPVSPRVITVPFYDPWLGLQSGRNTVFVTKIVFLFVESRGPGSLITTRIVDVISPDGTPVLPATWGRLKGLYRNDGPP